MSELNSYEQCVAKLGTRVSRKIANNTYLKKRDENIVAVLLHSTDIIEYHENGRIVLNTGGWQTVTTKERMNRFSPFRIWSDKGVWIFSLGSVWDDCQETFAYQDGVTLCNGELSGAGEDPKKVQKLRARARKYANDYMKALVAGDVPKPSAGDCFMCQFKTGCDGDHILSHMRESYFVPSLIVRAFDTFGASQAMHWALGTCWGEDCGGWSFGYTQNDFLTKQAVKMIFRFCCREMGLAA